MTYRTLNPTTGELLETFETQSDEDVAESLELAVAGFRKWRLRPLRERGASVLEVAARLEERSETLARLMAVEMGKPIAERMLDNDKPKYDLSGVVAVSNGAAPLTPGIRKMLRQAFPDAMLVDAYGSSETGATGVGTDTTDHASPRFTKFD